MALPRQAGVGKGWPVASLFAVSGGVPANALISRVDSTPLISRVDGTILTSRIGS